MCRGACLSSAVRMQSTQALTNRSAAFASLKVEDPKTRRHSAMQAGHIEGLFRCGSRPAQAKRRGASATGCGGHAEKFIGLRCGGFTVG